MKWIIDSPHQTVFKCPVYILCHLVRWLQKVGHTKLHWAYRLPKHTLNTSKLQYNGRAMERHC